MSLVYPDPVSYVQPSKFEFGELDGKLQWWLLAWTNSRKERSFSKLGQLLSNVLEALHDLDGLTTDAEEVGGSAGILGEACSLGDRGRVVGQIRPLSVVSND